MDPELSDGISSNRPGWRRLLREPGSFLFLLFAFLPGVFGTALSIWALQNQVWFQGLSFLAWAGVFVALAFLIAFSFIPNTLAGMLVGFFIGFRGLPGMIFSFLAASLLGYAFALRVGSGLRETVMKIWPQTARIFQRLGHDPISLVAGLRMMPVPPFSVGSLVLTWFQVPFRAYLLGSLLGMVPRMTLMVLLGTGAQDIYRLIDDPFSSGWVSLGTALLLALGVYLVVRSVRRRLDES